MHSTTLHLQNYLLITGASTGLPVLPSGGSSINCSYSVLEDKSTSPEDTWDLKVLHIPIGLEVPVILSTELRSCYPLSADTTSKTHLFRLDCV